MPLSADETTFGRFEILNRDVAIGATGSG